MDPIKQKVDKITDQIQLNQLFKSVGSPISHTFECVWIDFSKNFEKTLVYLERFANSKFFARLLDESSALQNDIKIENLTQLDLELNQVLATGRQKVKLVREGKINLEKIYAEFENMDVKAIANEIILWSDNTDVQWIEQRMQQIYYLIELEKCAKATLTIQLLANKFALKLQNAEILQLCNDPQEINKILLGDLKPDLLKSGEIIQSLKNEHITALNEFTNQSDFVLWLRMETNNDPRGFRTLIDLAQIAAGAGLEEIRIVDLIEKAVTGYESLIFGILEVSTLSDLLKLCEPLWKNLQANPNLPKSLKDSVGYKRWLEQVKTTHGSVEQSALDQARLISTSGTFLLESDTNCTKPAHLLEVADVLLLEIEDEAADEVLKETIQKIGRTVNIRKKYSFRGLQELQNKLMLIAGQAYQRLRLETGVERFIQIFDQITLLARRYIKLRQLGTLIFDEMKCEIFCNPTNDSSLRVNFGFGTGNRGILQSQKPVIESIKELINIFEKCIDEW